MQISGSKVVHYHEERAITLELSWFSMEAFKIDGPIILVGACFTQDAIRTTLITQLLLCLLLVLLHQNWPYLVLEDRFVYTGRFSRFRVIWNLISMVSMLLSIVNYSCFLYLKNREFIETLTLFFSQHLTFNTLFLMFVQSRTHCSIPADNPYSKSTRHEYVSWPKICL